MPPQRSKAVDRAIRIVAANPDKLCELAAPGVRRRLNVTDRTDKEVAEMLRDELLSAAEAELDGSEEP